MFNLSTRTAPVLTGNATTTVRNNKLIVDGVPVSASVATQLLQRDIYKDGKATGDTFTGGVAIRLGTFNADGEYLGLVKKLSATFSNSEGNTSITDGDLIAKAAIAGTDISQKDFEYRFMVGVYTADGSVAVKYDDREHKPEYDNDSEAVADPLAKFHTEQAKPATERKGIGFINIYSWSTKEEKYFRIGATQLDASDATEVIKLLKAHEAGYLFAPVVTPTAAVTEWLSASASPAAEASPLSDFLDLA